MHPAVVLTSRPHANANNKLRIEHSSVKRQRTYVVLLEKHQPRRRPTSHRDSNAAAATCRHADEASRGFRNRGFSRSGSFAATRREGRETKSLPRRLLVMRKETRLVFLRVGAVTCCSAKRFRHVIGRRLLAGRLASGDPGRGGCLTLQLLDSLLHLLAWLKRDHVFLGDEHLVAGAGIAGLAGGPSLDLEDAEIAELNSPLPPPAPRQSRRRSSARSPSSATGSGRSLQKLSEQSLSWSRLSSPIQEGRRRLLSIYA